MGKMIYKIVTRDQWRVAESEGVFAGAPVDLSDGFIHFSTAAQLRETARRHFSGQTDLLLVTADSDSFGARLAWEKSRGGAMFPHLYDNLRLEDVLSVVPIAYSSESGHAFPADIP